MRSTVIARCRPLAAALALALALVLVVLAGCRGPRPSGPAGDDRVAPTQATPTFDGLFVDGARWRFRVEVLTDGEVEDAPQPDVICRVTALRTFPGGRASEVDCGDDPEPTVRDKVAGAWIQTDAGLWYELRLPDDGAAPDLDPDARLVPARLTVDAYGVVTLEPDPTPPPGDVSTEIHADGDAWCVATAFGGGETSWDEICLAADGPRSGHAGHGSEVTHEVRFELAGD